MYTYLRSQGTFIVGPWVIDRINSYRDLRTGTQYIGNRASRVHIYIYIYTYVDILVKTIKYVERGSSTMISIDFD